MNIHGKKVIIRAIEETDLEVMQKAINSAELEEMENGYSFPVSMQAQRKWFETNASATDRNVKMIIEYDKKPVGYTNILNIDWKNRVAHTGIKIFSTEYRNRGLGRDSVMAIMRFAFEELNLNRLEGYIIEYNKPSYALYVEKCGWKVEGRKREFVYKNGKYHDLIMVGILKSDYEALLQENHYWDED